jgi:anti-sigma factor RsiW
MATSHITCDELELYPMERLPESDTAPVEEHLLVCEECQARLADFDVYVRAMRAAMRSSRATCRSW